MPDLTKPVEFSFILGTIGVILAVIAVAIYVIKIKKDAM